MMNKKYKISSLILILHSNRKKKYKKDRKKRKKYFQGCQRADLKNQGCLRPNLKNSNNKLHPPIFHQFQK